MAMTINLTQIKLRDLFDGYNISVSSFTEIMSKTGACENAIRLYMDKMRKAVKTIK